MALADTLDRLPPWALYGGAGVLGGGAYLLYRKRRSAAPTAAPTAAPAPILGTESGQQPSIVPYYLTSSPSGAPQPTRPIPPTRGASIPTSTGVGSPGTLPDIPPILPVSPTAPTPPPPAPAPAPSPPSPAPAPAPGANNNIPADLLRQIEATGERIIGQLTDPKTGGTWWLGSYGGVFAQGGARYLGSARPYGFGPGAPRTAIAIQPLGSGYRVISSRGENYDFAG